VELDEASTDVIKTYYDVSVRCKELEAQKELLNESIKELLKAKNAKKGRMPGFVAVLDLRKNLHHANHFVGTD